MLRTRLPPRLRRVLARLDGRPRRVAALMCFAMAAAGALAPGPRQTPVPSAGPMATGPSTGQVAIAVHVVSAAGVRPGTRISLVEATSADPPVTDVATPRASTVVRVARVLSVGAADPVAGSADGGGVLVVAIGRADAWRVASSTNREFTPIILGLP